MVNMQVNIITGCFKKELYNGIPNVTVASVMKTFTLSTLND
jgi:hypothetical protein